MCSYQQSKAYQENNAKSHCTERINLSKLDSNLITRLANNALDRENQNTPDKILQFQYY